MASGRLQNRASCANPNGNAGLYGRVWTSCPYRCPCPGQPASCWMSRLWAVVSLINSLALYFPFTQLLPCSKLLGFPGFHFAIQLTSLNSQQGAESLPPCREWTVYLPVPP